jgi:hypothetical protein
MRGAARHPKTRDQPESPSLAVGGLTSSALQPCRQHRWLHRPPAAHRGWTPLSSTSVTATPPAARVHAVRLTAHTCPRSPAQETVTASCPRRPPLSTPLSLACARRCVQDGGVTHAVGGGEREALPLAHTRAGRHVRPGEPPCAVSARPWSCLWRHRGVAKTAASLTRTPGLHPSNAGADGGQVAPGTAATHFPRQSCPQA